MSAVVRVRCPAVDTTLLVDRSTAWLVRAPGATYASWRCTCSTTHDLDVALTIKGLAAFRYSGIPVVDLSRDPELLDSRRSPSSPQLGATDVSQLVDELWLDGRDALVELLPESFIRAVLVGRSRPPG